MQKTTKYELNKIEGTDLGESAVKAFNDNMDTIDSNLSGNLTAMPGISIGKLKDGSNGIGVSYWENILDVFEAIKVLSPNVDFLLNSVETINQTLEEKVNKTEFEELEQTAVRGIGNLMQFYNELNEKVSFLLQCKEELQYAEDDEW